MWGEVMQGGQPIIPAGQKQLLAGQQQDWAVVRRWVLQWYLMLACLAVKKLEEVEVYKGTSESPISHFLFVLCLLVT